MVEGNRDFQTKLLVFESNVTFIAQNITFSRINLHIIFYFTIFALEKE